jgi:hypothetical protein
MPSCRRRYVVTRSIPQDAVDFDPRGLWSKTALLPATMTGTNREACMRIKPDGTLDEVWREPADPWWKMPQQEYDALLERILRNNPTLTHTKAKEMLDASIRRGRLLR